MELLLLKYGYLLLFLGVVLEGEAFLLAGSLLANRGYFNLLTVALVALAANTISAQFYYMAARVRGRRWLENRFYRGSRYQTILRWVNEHGNWVLVLSRFAFGFRIIIPAACGALGMPLMRFAILNVIAGLLWMIPTVFIGYYFGASIDSIVRDARGYLTGFFLTALLAVAAVLAARHVRKVTSIFQRFEWSDLHAVVPMMMGLMGLINVISAVWPGPESVLRSVRAWLPLEVSQGSRMLMLFAGVALLQVTWDLSRRKQLAWYVAVISLSASLMLHFTSGLDVQNSLIAALLLTYLIYFRRRFYTRTDPASLKKGLAITPLLLLLVFFYGVTGFAASGPEFIWDPGANAATESVRAGILIIRPHAVPASQSAALFLTSLQIAGWIARIYILVLLLRPVILHDRLEAPQDQIDRIFRLCGKDPLSAFAIQRDKHHLLVANNEGLVAYSSQGAIALACGDPLAPPGMFEVAFREYVDHCRRHGWIPCIYMAAEENLAFYHSLRMQSVKVAEEAIIDLASFDAPVAIPSAMPIHRYDRSREKDALIDEQLEEVSEDWLETRHLRELSFTTGYFSLESISDGPVFILGDRQRVQAFCGWLTYNNGRGAILDIVRQRRDASPEATHILLGQALRMLNQEFDEASIPSTVLHSDQIETFAPKWRSRYLVHPRNARISKIINALQSVQKR